MQYGVCTLAIVPLRAEPTDKSEMVSQLLFGDTFTVLEEEKKWVKVRMTFDNYEGWADKKQLTFIEEPVFESIKNWNTFLFSASAEILCNNQPLPIVRGALLPGNATFSVNEKQYQSVENNLCVAQPQAVQSVAMSYLGAPYLWGGRSLFGIDCSGFVQIVFKMAGITLLRDASQQSTQGTSVDWISEAKPCDVLFFDNEEGKIIHVGLFLGNGEILHASGCVRIDRVDDNGIFNKEQNAYTHKLRLIKRMMA